MADEFDPAAGEGVGTDDTLNLGLVSLGDNGNHLKQITRTTVNKCTPDLVVE